jgi:hypothetical protein
MARTKLFISYSHQDRAWLERLKLHLALLQRRGLVHVWSDTRIGVGDRWREEIESALKESRAAVLLMSPDFLASDFIWDEEMPKLLAHQKKGMAILPLAVRPCVWRIAPELAELQARPSDGWFLSLRTDAEIDLALAEFVYELADRLEQLPATVASEERELLRARFLRVAEVLSPSEPAADPYAPRAGAGPVSPVRRGQTWVGTYHPTRRELRLRITAVTEQRFSGEIEYADDGSMTAAEGEWDYAQGGPGHEALRDVEKSLRVVDCAVTFRETRLVKKGGRPLQLGGEYIGLVSGPVMKGVWQSQGKVLGNFELRLEE